MPASPAPKRKVAWSAVVSAAASKTCAAGASTSTVQILRAGVGSACPASLRARARKRCRPGRSPDTLTGDSHALKRFPSRLHSNVAPSCSGRQRERGGGGGDQTRRPALERRVRRRLDDERPEVDRARPEPVSVTRSEVEPPGARADRALRPPGGRGKIHDGVGKRARALAPLNRIAGRVAAGRPDDDDRPRARCFADPVARRMDIRRILDRHDRRAASSFGSVVPAAAREHDACNPRGAHDHCEHHGRGNLEPERAVRGAGPGRGTPGRGRSLGPAEGAPRHAEPDGVLERHRRRNKREPGENRRRRGRSLLLLAARLALVEVTRDQRAGLTRRRGRTVIGEQRVEVARIRAGRAA